MDLFENLSDNQIEAVKTIDEDLEIIACAGAGKTGVVTRRIINILNDILNIMYDEKSKLDRIVRYYEKTFNYYNVY